MSRATEKQYYKDIIKKAVPAKAVAPSKAPTKACTPSKAPKKIPTAPPAAPPKKVKYYIPGVIVDGQSYYEDNKGSPLRCDLQARRVNRGPPRFVGKGEII